jgi:hypothetical protein
MCRAYDDFLAARTEVQAVDPESVAAAGAADLAEDYYNSVRALKETTDGRFRAAVEALEAEARNVLLTLDSAPDDADYATWAPLVEDDLENTADAAAIVVELMDPECNPDLD